uniref:A disintegrin and metalloproteinase with thrombospondin motifs 9 n=1 Tax=Timema douglasi TaxID=61478 RepID=A0A7R8VNH9_TIMDO|nr:unnamed protein product [Timema douglasi]
MNESNFVPDETEVFLNKSQEEDAPHERRRRSLHRSSYHQKYCVEIMVVADRKMAARHGPNLTAYILALMSSVSMIFKDASIGNPMSIAVVKVKVLEKDLVNRDPHQEGTSAIDMLGKFCEWQATYNDPDDSSPHHHDAALLLTRETICRDPFQQKCDTLGLAELGTMCKTNTSCAIVQDTGLSAAFTIAHELGHVLSMPHDDDMSCRRFHGNSIKRNVMSRMLDNNTNPWVWSKCSTHYLTEFLETGRGDCLLDKPYKDLVAEDGPPSNTLPGENFTEDRQCELVFGPGSKICSYMPMCDRLWCTSESSVPQESRGCRTQHMPWADGTPCKKGMWCQKGHCIPIDRKSLAPRDGKWGEWSSFRPCTRTCGGGVKERVRACNNPAPANGGRYCEGERVRYRSCNIQECPEGSIDFREEQCARHNNKSYSISGSPEKVKWLPKYGIMNDRCTLYCRGYRSNAYYELQNKVIDGTPCGPDTFDICVNGICKHAGCNHVLGSRWELDICGKCNGDNSTCKLMTGSYNHTKNYGYSLVVRIPAGSSNIDIRQHAFDEKDDNYLVLLDGVTKDYILNGNYVLSRDRKVFLFAGTPLEYTGSEVAVERLNSSRPIKKDLVVEILSVGDLTKPPDITYQYTVSRDMLHDYVWREGNKWSACDPICHGEKHLKPVCSRRETLEDVGDDHCKGQIPPQTKVEPCNTHCTLKWQIWSRSECSVHCGSGHRTLTVHCVQEFSDTQQFKVLDKSLCQHILAFKPDNVEPCEGLCDVVRWKFGEWGPCSKTCGGGVQTRGAQCVDELDRVMEDSQCVTSERITDRVCGDKNCPQWSVDKWLPCSVKCGTGERQRPYWCQLDNHVVSPTYCHPQPVPVHKELCSMEPCAQWRDGPWEQCSTSCGAGIQRRMVTCFSINGSAVNDESCPAEDRPVDSQSCLVQYCPPETHTVMFPSTSTTTSVSLDDLDNSRLSHDQRNSLLPTADTADNLIPHGEEESNTIPVQGDPLGDQYNPPNRRARVVWKTQAWEPCSAPCGEGVKRRVVFCYDELLERQTDSHHCSRLVEPHSSEPCLLPRCVAWSVEDWQPCSVTCGKGVLVRKVSCIDSTTGTELQDMHACTELGLAQPSGERVCENTECPVPHHTQTDVAGMWEFGNWEPCSKTCGGGVQRRMVSCRVDDCSSAQRPRDTVPCSMEPCPTWNFGAWGECDRSCGSGYQHRQVRCQNQRGESLPDSACLRAQRPLHFRVCEPALPSCSVTSNDGHKEFKWRSGGWGACTNTCGKGMRMRDVHCVKGDWRVHDQYCQQRSRPRSVRGCRKFDCPFTWSEGEWSECSRTCGVGHQQRSVTCHRVVNGWPDPRPVAEESSCNHTARPLEQQSCRAGDCLAQFHWSFGDWQPCSQLHGKCKQKRDVFCHHRNGHKVNKKHCPKDLKPRHRRKCPQKKCGFSSCLEIQQKLNTRENREYIFNIRGRNVSIYCYNMDSNLPKEYLTLPTGQNRNYAEIYNRRAQSTLYTAVSGQSTVDTLHCCLWTEHSRHFTLLSLDRAQSTLYTAVSGQSTVDILHCCLWTEHSRHFTLLCLDRAQSTLYTAVSGQSTVEHFTLLSLDRAQLTFYTAVSGQSTVDTLHCCVWTEHRLQHPDTCPHEGERRDDCDCIQDAKGIAGLTVYSKIRLNVTSLRVNTKDYMFAQQQSGQWVAYAEAGDCYSKHNCPQGRFNIDLVGTGFVVSPSTKWQEHGSQPSLTINWLKNHQVVDGKCGGYCGTCRPHLNTGLKLDVLPP